MKVNRLGEGIEVDVPTRGDTRMIAVVCHKYGFPDVLKLEEVQKPTPRDD